MNVLRLLPFIFLLDSCLDPLAVIVISPKAELVVDGLITNQPGPYTVRLFYSAKPDTTTLKRPRVESNASVWIVDDDAGEKEQLTEIDTTKGTYISSESGMRGQVGRHYSLRVLTEAGKEYRSSSQELLAAGTLVSVYSKFEKEGLILKGTDPSDAFAIFVDARGVSNQQNFFRWRWVGTYKGQTFPELRKTFFRVPPPGYLAPDPEPCSGYIYGGGVLHKIAECTCCYCWVTEHGKSATVSDSRLSGENVFNKVEVAKIAVTPFHFLERYYIEVEQLSLSAEVYEFWKLARAQQQSAGSLFQPTSVHVRGNITSVTDPEEEVLGIFSVSGSVKMSLSISRGDVPVYLPPIDTLPINCMQGLYGDSSTNHEPIFW